MKVHKEIVAPTKPTVPYFRSRPKPAPLISHASKLYQKIPSPFRLRHRKPSHPHRSGQEQEHHHQNDSEKRGATPIVIESTGETQELGIYNAKIKKEAGGGHHGDQPEQSQTGGELLLYDSGSGLIPAIPLMAPGSEINYEKVFLEVMRQPSSRRPPTEIYNSHGFLPGANQQQHQNQNQQLPPGPGPGPGPDNTNSTLFKNTRSTIKQKQSNAGLGQTSTPTNRNISQPRIKSGELTPLQQQQQQQQNEIFARYSQHHSEIIEPGHNSPKIIYTKSSNWEADTSITHSEMEQYAKMKYYPQPQHEKKAVVLPSRNVRSNDPRSKLTKSKTTKNTQQIKKPIGFGFGTDSKSRNSSLVNKTKRITPMTRQHSSSNLHDGSRSPRKGASRTFIVYNEQGQGQGRNEVKLKTYSNRSPSLNLVADVTKNNDENISARETIYVPLHPTEQPYALKVSTGTSDRSLLVSPNPNKKNAVPKQAFPNFVNTNERRSRTRSIRSIKRDKSAHTNSTSAGPPPRGAGAGTRTGLRLSEMQLKSFTESSSSVRSQRFGGLKSWKPQQQPWNSQPVNERALVTKPVVNSGTQANLTVTISPPAPHGTDVNSTTVTVGNSRGPRSAFGATSSKPKPPKYYPPDHEKFETLSSRNKKSRRYLNLNNFIKRPKHSNKVPQMTKSISGHRIQTQTEESSLKAEQVAVTITNHPASIPINNGANNTLLKHRSSKQHVLKPQPQPHTQSPADHLGQKKVKSPFKSPGAAGVINDVVGAGAGAGAASSPLGNSNHVRSSDSTSQSSSHKKQKPVKSKTSVKTTSSKKTRRHSTTVTIIGELSKLQKSKLPIIWVFGYTQISIVENVITILNGIANHLNYYLIDLDKEIASWTDSTTFQQQQRAQFEGPADDDDELLHQLLQRQLLLLQSQSENQVSDQYHYQQQTSEHQNEKNENQNKTTANTPHAFKSKSKAKGLHLTFKDDIIIQAAKILTKVVGMVNKYLEMDDILELITLAMIRAQVEEDPKPRGYVIKNFPLFAAEGEAFENYLYEAATGIYMLPESETERIQNGHLVESQRYFMREQEYNEMAVRDAVDKIGGKYPVQIYVPSDENTVMRGGKLQEIIYLVQSRMEMLNQIQQAKSQNQLLNAGVTGVQQWNNGTSDGGGNNRGKSKLGNKNSNSNNKRNHREKDKEDTNSTHSHSPSVRTPNNSTAKKVKSRNNTSHTINNAKKNEF